MSNPKFHEFLLERAGGEAEAHTEFVRTQLSEMIEGGAKLGEIVSEATEQGWEDVLFDMSLNSLVPQQKANEGGNGQKRAKRIAPADVCPKILEALADGEAKRIGDVAKEIGLTSNQVRPAMTLLLQDGSVMRLGERASTTYQLA